MAIEWLKSKKIGIDFLRCLSCVGKISNYGTSQPKAKIFKHGERAWL